MTERVYEEIEGVYQKNSSGYTWYAGYGARIKESNGALTGLGCYLVSTHDSKREAKQAARDHAEGFRNTVLTLGGCTFETLPAIVIRKVGGR